jgi:hypothetical protein
MKKVLNSTVLTGVLVLFPLSAEANIYLENSLRALQVAAGQDAGSVSDVNGDGKTGLAETIYSLQLAAEVIVPRVSSPILRTTLPASWDEDWFASPAVYDLDGDGQMEIIAGRHSVLYVWNSAGSLLWIAPVGENGSGTIIHGTSRQYASPVVGDLDNDGRGEIAVAYSNKVAVYSHDGLIQSGWPRSFPNSTHEIRSIAAADLNNDGLKEILAVKTGGGPVTMVWHINGDSYTNWPQVNRTDYPDSSDYGGYNQNIGAADVDGDGYPEVISTYDMAGIGFYYGDGSPMPANDLFSDEYVNGVPMFHDIDLAIQGWGADGNDRDEFTDTPPVFADIDNDLKPEVILYSDHERAGEYVNRGNCLWVLNEDLTRVNGFETPLCSGMPLFTGYENNIVQVCPAAALGNLCGDSRPEIVVPSYDGFMRAYSPDGTLVWRYRFDDVGGDFIGASGAALADLNGDGIVEVVFSTYSTVNDISHLMMLDAAGKPLHSIPLPKRGSMSVPTIADVDGDGVLEIVLSLKDTLGGGYGGVQIYDVSSATESVAPWPTGRGNLLRDGSY